MNLLVTIEAIVGYLNEAQKSQEYFNLAEKNCDAAAAAERDKEIAEVKADMEALKAQKVLKAKEKMQELKKAL